MKPGLNGIYYIFPSSFPMNQAAIVSAPYIIEYLMTKAPVPCWALIWRSAHGTATGVNVTMGNHSNNLVLSHSIDFTFQLTTMIESIESGCCWGIGQGRMVSMIR